jgi:hypothetical protein
MMDELADGDRMDFWARGERAATEMGPQSLGEVWISPAEEAMAHEEGRESAGCAEVSERAEVFARLLLYIMGGSFSPLVHGERLVALAWQFGIFDEGWTDDLAALRGKYAPPSVPEDVWSDQGLSASSYLPMRALVEDGEWRELLVRLVQYLFAEGGDVERAIKRVWALCIALQPALVAWRSLQEVADVFGETRAAVSNRVRRVYSLPIERAGGCGTAWFQKRPETVEKYREAQRGNRNRLGTGKDAKRNESGAGTDASEKTP